MADVPDNVVVSTLNEYHKLLAEIAEKTKNFTQAEMYVPEVEVHNGNVQSIKARAILRGERIHVEVVSRHHEDLPEDFVNIAPEESVVFDLLVSRRKSEG